MDKNYSTLSNLLRYRKIILLSLILAGLLVSLNLDSILYPINAGYEKLMRVIGGAKEPDNSIVIVHINSDDIEQLGGWPLKRSYYALLIDRLNKIGAGKIGLEVMFSSRLAFQEIYNDLLNEVLKKSNNVVLSSIVGASDTIIYSQPKYDIPSLKTGHLNYIVSDGYYVPEYISVNGQIEKAFAVEIAGDNFTEGDDLLKVNFYNSWRKFQNYSLIEFFEVIENNPTEFKKKFVLIGVSDPTIAKTVSTFYDKELPGVGFHAFVLDNIITSRSLNYKYSNLLSVLAVSSILMFVFLLRFGSPEVRIVIYLFFILISSFVLFNYFYVVFNYTAALLPAVLIFAFELYIRLSVNKRQALLAMSESELLKRTLESKEALLDSISKHSEQAKGELLNQIEKLKSEIKQLKELEQDSEPAEKHGGRHQFENIVYKSDEMDKIIKTIEKVAPTDATVLVVGESGSGKELVARAIHNLSNRREKEFIAVNCAALTESLLESELFGYVKGAFTNAVSDKKGLFEAADGGTIFLDEIAETSDSFQAKLLRVIQFGELQKVGSTQMQKINVRIIAATNKNLTQLIKEGKFREDLYYRLNVFNIEIPPLRERKEDIPILAEYFLECEADNLKFSKAVLDSLAKNEWKGNVRELESIVKRAAVFAKAEGRDVILLSDLPDDYRHYRKADLEDFILDSLRAKKFSHSSVVETAREIGNVSRTVVGEILRGLFFKNYVQNDYDFDAAVRSIAGTDEEEVLNRLKSKAAKYLENIENDLKKIKTVDFEEVKRAFTSKYKNLPVRYHDYLDAVIRFLISRTKNS
ncbi:DNA-binding response regulator HsfA [Melioribacter roseus P3M-2]|uniref:DNA-binding response regulator HsfA n=1 Tax=Melioribacter roseus (strain DSM 23840 / JCM 17771 / VKM B-2668 / P3M-2) TaxID=1191523 RepID=I7A0R9_MELRP|nr:sigma 54-interacting transcriptional regulator [Melioribacter roseus]AFN74838.1 DNA-binding response regulator HsfA [Melioribacter roseus P3M-2]